MANVSREPAPAARPPVFVIPRVRSWARCPKSQRPRARRPQPSARRSALCGLQRLLLHQHGLHQQVGRRGLAVDKILDQRLGFAVARLGFEGLYTAEQAGDELAFLGLHDSASCPFGSKGTVNVVVRPPSVKGGRASPA
jgi:hypothetical protein